MKITELIEKTHVEVQGTFLFTIAYNLVIKLIISFFNLNLLKLILFVDRIIVIM